MEAGEQSVRRAVLQFALAGLLAVLVIGAVTIEVMRSIGRSEAIADAEPASRLAGRAVVAPLVTEGVVAARPADVARLDRVVRRHLLGNPFVRVKVWTAGGRIVYADEPRLVGARYPLDEESLEALHRQEGDAEISGLSGPENRFERRHGELLEVYQGITGPDGDKMLFEAYQPDNPRFREHAGEFPGSGCTSTLTGPPGQFCVQVTPRVNIANDASPAFVARDSAQLAVRVPQPECDTAPALSVRHCGGVSVWDVASGGRMGFVSGEDATEVANPPTACDEDCQAQNQVQGRLAVLGHPFPVPATSRLTPRFSAAPLPGLTP
jgi:hypothetical protein